VLADELHGMDCNDIVVVNVRRDLDGAAGFVSAERFVAMAQRVIRQPREFGTILGPVNLTREMLIVAAPISRISVTNASRALSPAWRAWSCGQCRSGWLVTRNDRTSSPRGGPARQLRERLSPRC